MTAAPLLLACLLAPPLPSQQAGPAEPPPEPVTGVALRRQAAAALEAALDAPLHKPLRIEPGTSLTDVLAVLLPGQTVLPDLPRLDLEGVDLTEVRLWQTMNFPSGRVTRRAAVRDLLEQAGKAPLGFFNDDGVLRVTTLEFVDDVFVTRLYPVRDLLAAVAPWSVESARRRALRQAELNAAYEGGRQAGRAEAGGAAPWANPFGDGQSGGAGAFSLPAAGATDEAAPVPNPQALRAAGDELTDAVLASTGGPGRSGGWKEGHAVGGGTLKLFNGVLVVRQTEAVHRQIEDLLATLRAAFVPQPAAADHDAEPAEEPTE